MDYTYALYLPNEAFLFWNRGRVHRANKDYLEAWVDFSAAHFLEPENRRYLSSRDEVQPMALKQESRSKNPPGYGSKMKNTKHTSLLMRAVQ